MIGLLARARSHVAGRYWDALSIEPEPSQGDLRRELFWHTVLRILMKGPSHRARVRMSIDGKHVGTVVILKLPDDDTIIGTKKP